MKKLIMILMVLAVFLSAFSKPQSKAEVQQSASAYLVEYKNNSKVLKITADLQDQYYLENIADLKDSEIVCLIRIRNSTQGMQAYASTLKRDDTGYFVLAEDLGKAQDQRRTTAPMKGDTIFADKDCKDLIEK